MLPPNFRCALTAVLLLLVVLPTPVRAQAGDPVVATVEGEKILRSEAMSAMTSLSSGNPNMPPGAIYEQALDRLIDGKLIAIAGGKENLRDDAEFKQRMALVEERVIQQLFIKRYVEKNVTDAALRKRYDETYKAGGARQVRARHILLETEEQARAVIAQLNGGADFTETAKKSSIGPSAKTGGDLGFFGRDDMVPEFSDAAFKLKAGAITKDPVKTQFGWHVIKVEEERKATAPSFENAQQELRQGLTREVLTALVEKLRSQSKIQRFNMDGSAAPGGKGSGKR